MKLTNAVSNIARSGATRSGYPVLQGAKVPLYAISNIARSGATRSNYTGSQPFISIDGIHRGWGRLDGGGVIADSVTKSDAINNTPVTLTFTAYGWVPVEGADVVVTLGSANNMQRQFGGTILSTRHRYAVKKPVDRNMLYDVSCIDYTWALDRRKVSGNYTNASVAAIAASLMTYAPAGYTLRVDPDIGAERLDQITFTEQTLTGAFAQLAKRVGGDFLCDYLKVVHLFFENTALSPPRIVNAVHPTLQTIDWTRDLSQVATRILGNFGGSNALDQIAPGETLLPVETAAWYLPAGGVVLVGQQRVTYGGIDTGGGGSLVGPGASPTGAPNVSLLPGAGVTVGVHDYAVSYKTAAGESLAGPRVTVPVGVFLPPTTAPTAGTPGPGATGPSPGIHDYAVSFVISSGETVPGPRVAVSNTALTPAPTTGPTPTAGTLGVGPDPGVHDYAVVFQTATGSTTPGPIGGQIAVANTPLPAPTAGPTTNPATSGGSVDLGDHMYSLTFLTASGETIGGPVTTGTALPMAPVANPTSPPATGLGSGMNNVTGGWLYYSYAYRTGSGETLQSPTVEVQATLAGISYPNYFINIAVTAYASPDPAVSTIVFYRSFQYGGQGQKRQWATTSNVTSTQNDPCSNVNGPLAPTGGNNTVSAGPKQTIPLTNIQIGPAGTIARRLYRSPAVGGVGVQKLLATINNNSTTTYTDTTADSALGAQVPSGNTAYVLMAVRLTNIPRGTGASSTAVTARLLYRRSGGAGLRYLATMPDNSASTYDDTTPNAGLGAAPPTVNTATLLVIPLTKLPLGNSLVIGRNVYRTSGGNAGGPLYRLLTLADNTTTDVVDTVSDASLGAPALTVGSAQAAQVQLSAIPLGAASVIARVLYRTKAGLTPLQVLTTLADNTTTAYLDVTADAALGANPPTSDTSLLQQPIGNVLAGSPTLPCATVAAFRTTGGWAIVGSQNIRYTGISGNALLGIPPSGPGAITATITYNTTAVVAAMLTGIPATGLGVIKYPILKGDPVNVFVQVDDFDAQAATRLQLPGSDGVIEDEIQDGRLSYIEGLARCQARLDLLAALDSEGKVGVITVAYVCRDINTHAGATVTVNLGPPVNLRGDFLIQRVGVARFNIPHLNPTYTVEASSLRFSAEEMLRLLRQGAF
jgi:hypothetical protein